MFGRADNPWASHELIPQGKCMFTFCHWLTLGSRYRSCEYMFVENYPLKGWKAVQIILPVSLVALITPLGSPRVSSWRGYHSSLLTPFLGCVAVLRSSDLNFQTLNVTWHLSCQVLLLGHCAQVRDSWNIRMDMSWVRKWTGVDIYAQEKDWEITSVVIYGETIKKNGKYFHIFGKNAGEHIHLKN